MTTFDISVASKFTCDFTAIVLTKKPNNSINELYFKGIPLQYCPEFDDNFGGAQTPTISWAKRCYMLNLNHIQLRPIDGSDFVNRTPTRPATQYIAYMAVLWRGALTMNLPSAHACLSVA